jgi:serine/threonine protein kinase
MTTQGDNNQEKRIDEAIREFVEAQLRGDKPDFEELIRQYPHFENQIRKKIKEIEAVDSLLASLVQIDEKEFEITSASEDLIGQKIGVFEITEVIGRGGMGIVYLARDTKLERLVAIKSMPPELTTDTTARMRFQREAKLLASLNHPNIAVIHDMVEEKDGVAYLILEYIPGQTLAEHIAQKPMKLKEALSIAVQITEGLSAAYEKGVIHRDLKPGNIKITPDGKIKILDFGLAKAVRSGDFDRQNTVTKNGRFVGTPAYMSPEQARGQEIDHRTDIWAFGCILYEMLTGNIPFPGETVTDTLANILDREPGWRVLPLTTPVNIQVLLHRCLEKDIRKRLQHIGDANLEISETLSGISSKSTTMKFTARSIVSSRRKVLMLWLLLISMLLVVLVLSSVIVTNRISLTRVSKLTGESVRRFTANLLPSQYFTTDDWANNLALAPDGTLLAYVGVNEGQSRLYFHNMVDEFLPIPIDNTDGALNPFFSPDGQSIAFFSKGKLMMVSLKTWTISEICSVQETSRGGTCASDGTIFFNLTPGSGLCKVSATGGNYELVTKIDSDSGERCHCFPHILPDGRHVLFTIATNEDPDKWRIAVLSLETGKYHDLNLRGSNAYYVRPGYLVYAGSAGRLIAVPFNLKQLKVTGSTSVVIEDALTYPVAQYFVSESGTLAYAPGSMVAGRNNTLVWISPSGHEKPVGLPAKPYASVRICPDGQQVAVHIGGSASDSDIYIGDLSRYVLKQLTFLPAYDVRPRWAPISKRITYSSERNNPPQLYWILPDGTGDEPLWDSEPNSLEMPSSWSSDERYFAFARSTIETQWDIWILSMDDGRKANEFLAERYNEKKPAFHPRGNWIAYVSDETGRNEVYVRRFPDGRDKTLISTYGGDDPMWDPSGKSIYYRNGNIMMAVAMETEPSLPGQPRELFKGQYASNPWDTSYDVTSTPNGPMFLMIKLPQITYFNVVMNWFEELKQLAPTN